MLAQTGTYTVYGTGCQGSRQVAGGRVSPTGFQAKWGQSNNIFPLGTSNQHYMQVHAASDFGVAPIPMRSMEFRTKQARSLRARVIPCTVRIGISKNTPSALSTTFASNWMGTPITAFTGNLNVAATPANNSLTAFDTKIPFRAPFIYLPARGAFLWEFENKATSSVSNIYDFVNDPSTLNDKIARMWATGSTNATGTTRDAQGLVVRFPGISAGERIGLTNTGVPAINKSFQVNFSGAVSNSVAVLWLGASKLNINLNPTLPGCTLYSSLDLLVTGVATGTTGAGSATLSFPNNSSYVGIQLYNQWMVIDQAANGLGIVLSNGGEAKIGR